MKVKIKVSMDKNKIRGNHHLEVLKSFNKKWRKGSILEVTPIPSTDYRPESYQIGTIRLPKKYFK